MSAQKEKFGEPVLISPTFKGDGWAVAWAFGLFRLVHARWFARFLELNEHQPFGLKDERIRAVVLRMLERTYRPEERIFEISSVKLLEFRRLAGKAAKAHYDVSCRTMNIHAHEDDVSSLANAELVARRVNGPTQMLVIPDSYDVVVLDRKREAAIRSIVSFLTSDHEQAAAVAHQRKAI